ncbi:hypothetical protein KC678_02525 [Candidatus Dojkabacteria bacterium]|uniref:Uncharacterized protein n=1 Tax=Candidatus Dojkabacteria bacterium TaxID=2099670 RepID=A0A955I8X5_9BACT|nr:hypothetical protein [Candidatus Dojkabacteria bacterium]
MDSELISNIKKLLDAYQKGLLCDTTMPEETAPQFSNLEEKRIYYTLPMALNYQRNSYTLWESAKKTFEDKSTHGVFNLNSVTSQNIPELREKLTKHKLALQPNKHIDTWSRVARGIKDNFHSLSNLFDKYDNDFLEIKNAIQIVHKKEFPYLSGPKIFNYWMFIMSTYGEVPLKNRSYIEIAPDTHVLQASIKLKVISQKEADSMSRDTISQIWRTLLKESTIDPIDVHSPLWFWSRSGFDYKL